MIVSGEPFNPKLHITLHQIVASQLLADDPPETWQTVQRLARLGYDWHNVTHLIAAVVSDDLYLMMKDTAVDRAHAGGSRAARRCHRAQELGLQ